MKIENIIKALAKTNKSSTFVAINDYVSNKGTKKNYLINFHTDYVSAVEKSIIQMFKFEAKTEEEKTAKEEILSSLRRSLDSNVALDPVFNGKDQVKGLGKNGDKIFLTGFLVKQDSTPKTTKQKMFAELPVSKFRQFELNANKMKSLVIDGRTIKL